MPAPIINGLVNFLTSQLSVTVWDGEVPRYDTGGNAVNPSATSTVPTDWPAIKLYMQEGGFDRQWTTEDPYTDTGEILIQVWGISRSSVETTVGNIETLFAQAANWAKIQLGGPAVNPYYVIQMLLLKWYIGQEEGQRTGLSELLYRGDLHYNVMIHGVVATT